MKTTASFNMVHIILLCMTVIGLKNHVTILPPLLREAGRDGWMSVLLVIAPMLVWVFLLLVIHKNSKQANLRDWLEQQIGKVGSSIVLFIIIFSFLTLAAVTMRETLQWINATFLPDTPIILHLILYSILCITLVATSLRTILATNVIVLFGVIVLGYFVAFTNLQVKEFKLLLPLMEHGIEPVVKGMIYPASGFAELLLILLLQHKVKGQIRYFHYVIIIFIFTNLTIGPLVGAITEFGPDEAAKQRYPAYEEWGLVTLGRFFENLDFLSIYQWLTGAFIRMSVFLYVIADLLRINQQPKKIWKWIGPAFFISCSALLLLKDNTFIHLQGNFIMPITFFLFFMLTLFLWIVALVSKKTTRRIKHET